MTRRFFRAGSVLPAFLLSLALPLSLPAQENTEPFGGDFSVVEGEGITVTGTVETTQQMAVLDRDAIERAHAPDLGALLQETLGLNLTRYGGYGNQTHINIRGFDAERIAVLVDGVPVNSAMSGDFDITALDMNAIERIEVIYGGSDSKFNVSGALGGVINIITARTREQGFHLNGTVSNTSALPGTYHTALTQNSPAWEDLADAQYAALSASLGLPRTSLSVNMFFNRAENHFLYRHYTGQIRRKTGNEVWDAGGGLSVTQRAGEFSRFIVSGDFYYGDKNIPTSGTGIAYAVQRDIRTTQRALFDAPVLFGGAFATEASLASSWTSLEYTPPAGAPSLHETWTAQGINRWTWYARDRLTLRAGGDYRFVDLSSTDVGGHSRHDGGVYLTVEAAALKNFLVIPSFKGVFVSSGGNAFTPVPKLGLVFTPRETLTVKGNVFRGFKNPDFEDLYWASGGMGGNPNLRPEDGWGGDLGAAFRFLDSDGAERAVVETAGFAEWLRESIHWTPTGSTWRPENSGEAMIFGASVRLSLTIPTGRKAVERIGVGLSYQALLSYLLSYGYGFGSDKRIPYQPLHTADISLTVPWKSGSVIVSGHLEGVRFSDRGNLARLPPYFLLNLNLEQRITGYCSVFAVIRNALNWSYESYADYPMPGASLTLGARFTR